MSTETAGISDGVSEATEPAVRPAVAGWRPLTTGVSVLSSTVAVISIMTGLVLVGTSVSGHAFGAWTSPSPVTPGLIGAAMLGVAPGLFAVGQAQAWQQARTLFWPLAVVVIGMFVLCVVNVHQLQIVRGGPIVAVFFSLGWVGVFALLSLCVFGCLFRQYAQPAGAKAPPKVALPAWTKPALAVLGSSWFGIGTGLVFLPGFWAKYVPWTVNRFDAQALGIWALALGIGVLGTLAEDDLARIRPALLASGTTALALAAVLAAHPGGVQWHRGAAFALPAMVAGLLVSAVSGHRIIAAAAAE